MRRLTIAILLLVLGAGDASASGYSELNLGLAYRLRQDWNDAILHFTAALAAPDLPAAYRPTAYAARGEAYLALKEPDKAIPDYSAALAADPDYLLAYRARAFAYTMQGKIDLTIADLSAIIARRPALGAAYGVRGAAFAVQGRMDLAMTDFNAYVQLTPTATAAYLFRGAAHRQLHEYDAAISDFGKAIDIKDDVPSSYIERGDTYRDAGDYDNAERDLEHAAELTPNNTDDLMDLGTIQWDAGHYAAAAKTFARVPRGKAPDAYAVLWRYIAGASNGVRDDAALRTEAATLDLAKWPGPVIEVYLGQSTPDAAFAAAADKDAQTQANQICEAQFYVAEWQILGGNQAVAAPLLQKAQSSCPEDFIERSAAAAQLKRLP